MIKLKKLTLNNFGAYLGRHELTFPDKGLYSIVGKYEDEPERSNGAGKTFLVRAIAYCLDFAELSSSSLQNYNTEDSYSAELSLDLDGKTIEIFRDKNNYTVTYDNKYFKSTAAKEFLKQNILEPALISFVTYRQQDEKGNFLPLKPSEKVEFLSNLLNLDKYENLINKSTADLKITETAIDLLNSEDDGIRVSIFSNSEKIQLMTESLNKIENQKDEKIKAFELLKEPVIEDFIDVKRLEQLEQDKVVLRQLGFKSLKQKDVDELTAKIKQLADDMNTSSDKCEEIKEKLIEKIENKKSLNNEVSLLIEKKDWNLNKLKSFDDQKVECPQCEHVFHFHKADDEIFQLKKENTRIDENIHHKKDSIKGIDEYIERYKNVGSLDRALKQCQKLVDEIAKEEESYNTKRDKKIAEYDYEIKFSNENNRKMLEQAKQSYYIRIQDHKLDMDNFDKNRSDVQAKIDLFNKRDKELNEKKILVKDGLKAKRKERDYLNEVINCLGKENFIRLVTEETLALMTAKVNSFLAEIPNTEQISIRLAIDSETKKGALKKGINLQMFSSGTERPYEEFSGGEKCSVNLAIDAAISEIIAERTGKKFGWFILDEAQVGQDGITKMESLQVLSKLAQDKLILAIDHSDQINEYLSGQIIVLKNKEGSTIVTPNPQRPVSSNPIFGAQTDSEPYVDQDRT